MRPTLAIDWDGTCVSNTWPRQSRVWLPGAVEALHELTKHARVLIHTSRIAPFWPDEITAKTPGEIQGEINYIREMLDDAGLTGVHIHTQPWKPGAEAYLDDKAVHFAGRSSSWRNVTPKLLAMVGAHAEL